MLTQLFMDNQILCLVPIILVGMFVLSIRSKGKTNREWKEYNSGLDATRNDPKAREAYLDSVYGNTQSTRDAQLDAEEIRNQIVYKAIKKGK